MPMPMPRRKPSTPPRLVYHSDWFSEHAPSYDQILAPRLARLQSGARVLVVGTYEGRSVEWLVDHVAPGSHVVVLEEPVPRSASADAPRCASTHGVGVRVSARQIRATLKANLAILRETSKGKGKGAVDLRLIEAPSADGLATVRGEEAFDAILIDSLSSRHAMECAVMAFQVLRPGGVMVFTNYTHGRTHDASCPRRGIDGFLDAFAYEIQLLRIAFHLFLERRTKPLETLTPCRAEVSDPNPDPDPDSACKSKRR